MQFYFLEVSEITSLYLLNNNLPVFVKQGEKINSCGAILATEDTINEFAEIVGKENIFLKQL